MDQTVTSEDSTSSTVDERFKPDQSNSSLPQRKKLRRVPEKALRCDICPYRTNKLGLLSIHKTYHRPQAKNTYKCPHCPYYVCAPRLLHQHVRVHTVQSVVNGDARSGTRLSGKGKALTEDVTQFRCSVCPYVGRSKNDIIYHRQFHRARTTAPFRCPLCPFWVAEKRMLERHQKLHRGTRTASSAETGEDQRKKLAHRTTTGSGCGPQHGGKPVLSPSGVPEERKQPASGSDPHVEGGTDGEQRGRRRRVARTLWHCDRSGLHLW